MSMMEGGLVEPVATSEGATSLGGGSLSDSLSDPLVGAGSAVQLDGTGGGSPESIRSAAAEGISGSGSALPFANKIQASFGSHDISGIRSHTGSAAAEATASMNANAYATGNDVAFAPGKADLHTAAHEAAHVVQQSAGVQLSSGVGSVGDKYEQHADAVADRVVAGKSAEGLLNKMTGGSSKLDPGSSTTQMSVQLKPAVQMDEDEDDGGGLGDPSSPIFLYLSTGEGEKDSRQALARRLGVASENMCPLSSTKKFIKRLQVMQYNGRVIISSHAGTARRRNATDIETNQDSEKAKGLYQMLKPALFSRDDPPTSVDFLACNTGTSKGSKTGTSFAERFTSEAKEDGVTGMNVRAPKGFVNRGMGGMLSIVDKYDDNAAKNLGGKVVNTGDKDKGVVGANMEALMNDEEAFASYSTESVA